MVNVISKKLIETPIVEWPTKEQQIVVLRGDTREIIHCPPDDSIQCVVTSLIGALEITALVSKLGLRWI